MCEETPEVEVADPGQPQLEAQACGLPVLVSDRDGPRENMLPEKSGLVCRGGQVEDFTDAVVGLASNPARRRAMADAARRYALSRRWEQALVPLYDAFRSVAAQHRGGRLVAREPRRAVPPS